MSSGLSGAEAPVVLRTLFGELGDLKRIRSAGRVGSIAARMFADAWGDLVAGENLRSVAIEATASALAAARLGDIDGRVLALAGVRREGISRIFRRAIEDVGAPLARAFRDELASTAGHEDGPSADWVLPSFVAALQDQPRAGVTCPGMPRIVLEPPENHAEHCFLVSVYAVLLSPSYGADVGTVFLAGLSHHLHNAGLPDSGFAGEELLGDSLQPVMNHFTEAALAELEPSLRRQVEASRKILADAETPEGKAFHAADVIDRVLQIAQHLRAAELTMGEVLGEMALVHEGPVKPFHDRVLAEMGLP